MANKQTVRAARDAERRKRTDIRADVRADVRAPKAVKKVAAAATMLAFALSLLWAGCNSAQPLSKGMTSKACNNTVTVSLTIVAPTNALTLEAGAVTVSLSDVIGTQTMSADAGTSDTTSQTAMPTMANGLVGDKPVDAVVGLGKSIATGGVSDAATALSGAATTNAASGTATTN